MEQTEKNEEKKDSTEDPLNELREPPKERKPIRISKGDLRKKARERAKDRPIHEFWKTIDNVVNPLFFALIGLELLVVQWDVQVAVASVVVFPVVICARYASLLIPWLASLGSTKTLKINHAGLVLMTWAGIRGGVSFALALSIPDYITSEFNDNSPIRPAFLLSTFIVVVLSVIIQGLTTEPVAKRLSKQLGDPNSN